MPRRGWGFEAWSGADPQLLANVRFLAGYRHGSVITGDVIPAVLDTAGPAADDRGDREGLVAAAPAGRFTGDRTK
jgi:hypothetical protein